MNSEILSFISYFYETHQIAKVSSFLEQFEFPLSKDYAGIHITYSTQLTYKERQLDQTLRIFLYFYCNEVVEGINVDYVINIGVTD